MVLRKISFNRKLFLKEYKKSFRYLAPEDKIHFRKWAKENFISGR
jgi:hypothetical protein